MAPDLARVYARCSLRLLTCGWAHADIARWFGVHEPGLGCTPRAALTDGRIEDVDAAVGRVEAAVRRGQDVEA